MASRELQFDVLFRELRNRRTFIPGERVIFAEVSEDYFAYADVQFSAWVGFTLVSQVAIPEWARHYQAGLSDAEITQELVEFLRGEGIPNDMEGVVIGQVFGTLAEKFGVHKGLKAFFGVTFDPLVDGVTLVFSRQPNRLENYLAQQPCISPVNLTFLQTEVVDDDPSNPHLRIFPFPICEFGTHLDLNQYLKRFSFTAPSVNQPFNLVFRETDSADQHVRDVIYVMRATGSRQVAVWVYADRNTGWRLQVDNRLTPENAPYELSYPLAPPQIQIREALPNITFVIESTLGIYAKAEQERNKDTKIDPVVLGLTQFEAVYAFYHKLLDALEWATALRFLVLFYGDSEISPPEMGHRYEAYSQQGTWFLPIDNGQPQFVSASELERDLTKERFLEQQTYSVDWHKSLELAARALTNTPWDSAERIAIWIGQSPPHPYLKKGTAAPLDLMAYTSSINFHAQLRRAREDIKVVSFACFVNNDFRIDPVVQELRVEAEDVWRKIGVKHFYSVNLSTPDSDTLDTLANQIATVILNITHQAQTRRRVTFAFRQDGGGRKNYWALTSTAPQHLDLVFEETS